MTTEMQEFSTGDALATLADQFGQLVMSLADGADVPLTQQRLVEFAVRGVPGAEHASLTVVDGSRAPRTTAHTDELPYQGDQLQDELGEGPCLEVIATERHRARERPGHRQPLAAVCPRTGGSHAGSENAQIPPIPDRTDPRRAEYVRDAGRCVHRSVDRPPPVRCSPRTRRWRCWRLPATTRRIT